MQLVFAVAEVVMARAAVVAAAVVAAVTVVVGVAVAVTKEAAGATLVRFFLLAVKHC